MGQSLLNAIRGLIDKVKEITDKSLTGTKPFYISGTSAHNVNGYAVKALSDTAFTILTVDSANDSSTDLSGESMLAGDIWYVPVKKIELASGSVLVYLHNKNNS